METIDLVATATQILELLSDQGISGKSLHAYTHTGIGCVIRHFQAKGILCAAPEMLDAFLLEQREFFDQGAFSVWKWRLLRRGCELLAAARLDFLRPEDGKSPYQLQPFAKRAEKDVSR